MTGATNPKGERLDIKERKKQQRERGQDAHNGVWKTEQEMQLRWRAEGTKHEGP